METTSLFACLVFWNLVFCRVDECMSATPCSVTCWQDSVHSCWQQPISEDSGVREHLPIKHDSTVFLWTFKQIIINKINDPPHISTIFEALLWLKPQSFIMFPPFMYLGPEPDDVITVERVENHSALPDIGCCGSLGHLSVFPCPISGCRPALRQWWSSVRQTTESEGPPCLGSPRHPQSWYPGRGNALGPDRCPHWCTTLRQKE